MKMKHSIQGLSGASKNIGNAISFLQVQDGILSSAGDIVSRMGELKGLYGDVLKSTSDKATYDAEFADLQGQLYNLGLTKFNGIAIFGDLNSATGAAGTTNANSMVFGADDADALNSLNVFITEEGSSGAQVTINQTLLLSAVTMTVANAGNVGGTEGFTQITWNEANGSADNTDGLAENGDFSLAVNTAANRFTLEDVSSGFFSQALENLATARANNGGQVKRLQYAQADVDSKIGNMTAAHGRIMDVDIAAESSNLAKQQILVQAAAAMTAQANTANDVALMLLR
jgi:flagellin